MHVWVHLSEGLNLSVVWELPSSQAREMEGQRT